jgi:hypothetical protein
MKRVKRLFINLLVLGSIFVTAFMLMGIDAPDGVSPADGYPNGCVDCHQTTDYTLNVQILNISGHPDISMIVQQVPDGCNMCHKAGAAAGALSLITHENHDINIADGFSEACFSCHISADDISNKSGAKNW